MHRKGDGDDVVGSFFEWCGIGCVCGKEGVLFLRGEVIGRNQSHMLLFFMHGEGGLFDGLVYHFDWSGM